MSPAHLRPRDVYNFQCIMTWSDLRVDLTCDKFGGPERGRLAGLRILGFRRADLRTEVRPLGANFR
jgi:hypothetical protein